MLRSLARAYLAIIDSIRYGDFDSPQELRQMEGERGLLHQQMTEQLGHTPSMAEVRDIKMKAQSEGDY